MSNANRKLLDAIVQMFATGDLSEARAVFAPDYIDHQGLGETQIRGAEGFRRVVTAARAAFVTLDVRVEDVISEGDKLAARIHWRGTRREPSAGMLGAVDRETIELLRFRDAQVVEHWGARLWISGTEREDDLR